MNKSTSNAARVVRRLTEEDQDDDMLLRQELDGLTLRSVAEGLGFTPVLGGVPFAADTAMRFVKEWKVDPPWIGPRYRIETMETYVSWWGQTVTASLRVKAHNLTGYLSSRPSTENAAVFSRSVLDRDLEDGYTAAANSALIWAMERVNEHMELLNAPPYDSAENLGMFYHLFSQIS